MASVLGVFAGLFLGAAAAKADANALWEIVHGQCVPNQWQHRNPTPCVAVSLLGGFAVLKDLVGPEQYLLIPTRRISGIESPVLLAPFARNYFADAWRARGFVERAVGHPVPRDRLSLVINSQVGRSQNQLHIHIDCVRADVRDALQRMAPHIGWRWAVLDEPLAGHYYRAMRVDGPTLFGHNPFKLLAFGVPGARAAMGQHTLVVVAMQFGRVPGFVILDDRADLPHGDWANGEQLQDHDSCMLWR